MSFPILLWRFLIRRARAFPDPLSRNMSKTKHREDLSGGALLLPPCSRLCRVAVERLENRTKATGVFVSRTYPAYPAYLLGPTSDSIGSCSQPFDAAGGSVARATSRRRRPTGAARPPGRIPARRSAATSRALCGRRDLLARGTARAPRRGRRETRSAPARRGGASATSALKARRGRDGGLVADASVLASR